MIFLALLGFTRLADDWPLDDKLLHFLCMGTATFFFYWIVDVDEEARRIFFWRYFGLIFAGITCLGFGGIVSEIVQSMLPYKTFDWGDVLANLLGSSLGLYTSFRLERYYRHRREIARLYQPLGESEDSESEEELLPTTRSGKNAGNSAANKFYQQPQTRLGNVWDAREDFGIGDASDDDSDQERGGNSRGRSEGVPHLSTFTPAPSTPEPPIKIVVSQTD